MSRKEFWGALIPLPGYSAVPEAWTLSRFKKRMIKSHHVIIGYRLSVYKSSLSYFSKGSCNDTNAIGSWVRVYC